MKRRTRTKAIALTATLATGIAAYAVITPPSAPKPVANHATKPITHYVDRAAVLSALANEAQIVGLSGHAEKSLELADSKWYGDREYEMTIAGEFKFGIDSEDIEITTKGRTVVVRFPQPKLISADFPFDRAKISKDVGLIRKDFRDDEVQALYKKARKAAIADIKADAKVNERAEKAVEHAIEDILETVPYVDSIVFIDGGGIGMICTNCGKKINECHPFMTIISNDGVFCDIACENMYDMEEESQ